MLFAHLTLAVVRIQGRRTRAERETSEETIVEVRVSGLNWTVGSMNIRHITENITRIGPGE